MMYKIVNNKVVIKHNRFKENHRKSDPNLNIHTFYIPFCRTLYRQQSFFNRTIREWNSLPAATMSAQSVDSFMAKLTNQM